MGDIKKKDKKKGGLFSNMTDGEKIGVGANALGVVGNIGLLVSDIASKAKTEKARLDDTPITKFIKSDKPGITQIQQAQALASDGVRGGNVQSRGNKLAILAGKTGELAAKHTLDVSNINEASAIAYEERVSARETSNNALETVAETNTDKNKAARTDAIRQDVISLTSDNGLLELGKVKNRNAENSIAYNSLQEMYKDYGYEGTYDEFVKAVSEGKVNIKYKR